MNLSPMAESTRGWPLYTYPPPHFLVGYQYIIRVCNEYIFDQRVFSSLKFTELISPHQRLVNWSMLSNCSYTINTGAYHRFVDFENFAETLNQVQQAILADRVIADLAALQPLQGYGLNHIGNERNVPLEEILQSQYTDLGQCQDNAWGMAERIRIQRSGRKDLIILKTIRELKTAYFQYILNSTELNPREALSLPCDCDWLDAFKEKFADHGQLSSQQLSQIPVQTLLKAVTDALCLPGPTPLTTPLRGGAFELRPREGGLAVTEQMRRNRGEMIERFVDRLPIRRRRRRQPPPPQGDDEAEEEEGHLTFEEEVRAAVAEAIQALQDELTAAARNQPFFNFAIDFYNVLQRLEQLGDVNELTVRRWVMYFFVMEHIATTLNYLHFHLRNVAPFNRYVELNLAQLVMRARDEQGSVIYSRVWNEQNADAFENIMRRVSTDLAATVERAGHGDLDAEEIERFMSDIAYQENSGDVQEILRQVEMNDTDVDSIELSFRFRMVGPVAFSQHPEIQRINRRVVVLATQMRRNRQDLPELNAQVALPR